MDLLAEALEETVPERLAVPERVSVLDGVAALEDERDIVVLMLVIIEADAVAEDVVVACMEVEDVGLGDRLTVREQPVL